MPRKRLPEEHKKRKAQEKRTRYKERNKFVSVRRETLDRLESISRREKLTLRDTVTLLVKLYEDKVKEDHSYTTSKPRGKKPLQSIAPKATPVQKPQLTIPGLKLPIPREVKLLPQEVKPVQLDVKPKRKRGRPPKNRAVEINFGNSKSQRQVVTQRPVIPNGFPLYTTITTLASTNSRTSNTGVLNQSNPNLSPAVKSARIAFSRALQNSCKALVFQEPPSSFKKQVVVVQDRSTTDSELTDFFGQQVQGIDQQDNGVLMDQVFPQEDNSVVMVQPQGFPQEDNSVMMEQPQGIYDEDNGVMINQSPVLESVSEEETLRLRVLGEQDVCQDLDRGEPAGWILDQGEEFQEVNQEEHETSKQEVTSGLNHDRIQLDFGKEEAKRRVPDPTRRSRLNQITGGLLNKLKMKAVGEATDS